VIQSTGCEDECVAYYKRNGNWNNANSAKIENNKATITNVESKDTYKAKFSDGTEQTCSDDY
jgi:hypothetical protein